MDEVAMPRSPQLHKQRPKRVGPVDWLTSSAERERQSDLQRASGATLLGPVR